LGPPELVDVLGEEGGEGRQGADHGEEHLEEGGQPCGGVGRAEPGEALEPLAVEADVPVGQVIDGLEEPGYDGVESVSW
jgi:hypothetical protein